jgi:hypothetical protein
MCKDFHYFDGFSAKIFLYLLYITQYQWPKPYILLPDFNGKKSFSQS